MSKIKKGIINPNVSLTTEESGFIQENRTNVAASGKDSTTAQPSEKPVAKAVKKRTARPRNFSIYDDFYEELTNFLAEFPSEGNKSSLITRVVTEYIEQKRMEKRKRNNS